MPLPDVAHHHLTTIPNSPLFTIPDVMHHPIHLCVCVWMWTMVCACNCGNWRVSFIALLVAERYDVMLVPVTHPTAHYSYSMYMYIGQRVCMLPQPLAHSLTHPIPIHIHIEQIEFDAPQCKANATRSTRMSCRHSIHVNVCANAMQWIAQI